MILSQGALPACPPAACRDAEDELVAVAEEKEKLLPQVCEKEGRRSPGLVGIWNEPD